MHMEQGEIILVRYPFIDPRDYKIRPAIVMSNSGFNKKFSALVCPITTKKHATNIQINNRLNEGQLDKESYVRTSILATIHPELILKVIGKAKKETITEIKRKIINNF